MGRPARGVSSIGAMGAFLRKGSCSEALCHALDRAFGHELPAQEHACMPLAGGIVQHGYQCGMLWGAVLAAGAEAHRRFGAGAAAQTRAIAAARRIVDSFRAQNGHVNCLEITELNEASTAMQLVTFFLVKGGLVGCLRMAGRFAPLAFREISAAFAEAPGEVSAVPASCATVLAERMGTSELHATMAAGLAGGIGLCGGACGALGAAIWLIGMRATGDDGGKLDFKSPAALEAIRSFLECTDYEFECAAIVGRSFGSAADHACHLRDGGCARVIETLAAC